MTGFLAYNNNHNNSNHNYNNYYPHMKHQTN